MSKQRMLRTATSLLLAAGLLVMPARAAGHHSDNEPIKAGLIDEVLRWEPLIEELLPESDPYWVLHLIQCESRGDPNTRFLESWDEYSIGLTQVNEGWLRGWTRPEWRLVNHADPSQPVDLADPVSNLQAVKWIRHYEDTHGEEPWSQWACTRILAERGIYPPELTASEGGRART